MNSTAWLKAQTGTGLVAAGQPGAGEPGVIVDGQLEQGLRVMQYTRSGLLDEREITLEVVDGCGGDCWTQGQGWQGRRAVMAKVHRLPGGELRWEVLGQGIITAASHREQVGRVQNQLQVREDWTEQLQQPVENVLALVDGQPVLRSARGVKLAVGDQANRSDTVHEFGSMQSWAVTPLGQGTRWHVRAVLELISTWGNLRLSWVTVPVELLEEPLTHEVDLSKPMGQVLAELLQKHGLMLVRHVQREGGTISERREIRLMKHGRRCGWPGASPGVEAGMPQHRLMKLRQSMETQGAREWIAEAQGWEIESTFTLQPGWDPALEGQPAQTYSPVTNLDFANVAQVYRLWVLNEDGAFGFASGQALPRFDLAAFFEDARVQPQRLHLGDCLVTEQGRVRRKPVVEHSIDGGQTWQAWAGRVTVLADRAGIQFEDAQLPEEVFTAAQAGLWRVRITASLRSSVPMMVRRWQGNPLGTTQSARQLQAEDAFSFRRIDSGSIHHQAVRAGELEAMEVDDSHKLWQWLLGRMARDQTESLHGQADLELSGAQTHWRPGDQLMQVQDGQTWRVAAVECHWPASALAANNSSSSGPITRLHCQATKGG